MMWPIMLLIQMFPKYSRIQYLHRLQCNMFSRHSVTCWRYFKHDQDTPGTRMRGRPNKGTCSSTTTYTISLLSQPGEGTRARVRTRPVETRRVTRGHRVCVCVYCGQGAAGEASALVLSDEWTHNSNLCRPQSFETRPSLFSTTKQLCANWLIPCVANQWWQTFLFL